jgi:hypothetical protein
MSFRKLLILLLLLVPLASATDRYVSSGGSGSTCSAGSPCSSSTGIAATNAGDVLHFQAGTYGCINTNRTGTSSARIRYVSDVTWAAKISCSGLYGWQNGTGSNTRTADYVDIVGFEIQGTTGGCEGISNFGAFAYIHGNYVHDFLGQNATTCSTQGGGGIVLRNNGNPSTVAHDSVVDGNIIDNIGKGDDGTIGHSCITIHGIYMASPRQTATNNIISRACAWGIHMFHDTYQDVVSNNVIINNYHGGIIVSASDGFTNNNTTVNNNIVANNQGEAPIEERWGQTGSSNVYYNNMMWGNTGGNAYYFANGPRTNSGLLSGSNSTFVSYNSSAKLGDFHLASGSAAIGGGSKNCASGGLTACVPTTDFEAKAVSNPPPIGAYTFGSLGALPSPPSGLGAVVN